MDRQPLVAGNWKMHGAAAFVRDYAATFADAVAPVQGVEIALLPPAGYLGLLRGALDDAGAAAVRIGAQDIGTEASGAFTGEMAAEMVADLGAVMTLAGHSERRAMHHEDDALVARKFAAALRAGLTPVLCVGETLEERQAGRAHEVVARQLGAVLDAAGADGFTGAVVAYEPVWAIGTGETTTPEQAQDMHAAIRAQLGAAAAGLAEATRVLYGGSVNAGNARALFAMPDIDGGLVGGASLKAADFAQVVAAAARD